MIQPKPIHRYQVEVDQRTCATAYQPEIFGGSNRSTFEDYSPGGAFGGVFPEASGRISINTLEDCRILQ